VTPAAALARAEAEGLDLTAEGGTLRVRAARRPSPELLADLRCHKQEILLLLDLRAAAAMSKPLAGADPDAIAARAAELLAEAQANRAITITDAARATEYFRARALQEWAAAGNRNPMRPPRFQAPTRWWSDSRPAWCTGCNAVATWRADPPPAPNPAVLRWRCVRCGGPIACDPQPKGQADRGK
jgi:hypothetical protein